MSDTAQHATTLARALWCSLCQQHGPPPWRMHMCCDSGLVLPLARLCCDPVHPQPASRPANPPAPGRRSGLPGRRQGSRTLPLPGTAPCCRGGGQARRAPGAATAGTCESAAGRSWEGAWNTGQKSTSCEAGQPRRSAPVVGFFISAAALAGPLGLPVHPASAHPHCWQRSTLAQPLHP